MTNDFKWECFASTSVSKGYVEELRYTMREDDIQESKCNLATTLTENTETGL